MKKVSLSDNAILQNSLSILNESITEMKTMDENHGFFTLFPTFESVEGILHNIISIMAQTPIHIITLRIYFN